MEQIAFKAGETTARVGKCTVTVHADRDIPASEVVASVARLARSAAKAMEPSGSAKAS